MVFTPPVPARSGLRLSALAPFAAVALAVALLVPLLVADPLLSRDDQTLLRPLRSMTTLGEYAEAVAQGRVLDLQPVRDASFALDLWLSARLGVGTFHTTSAVLFVLLLGAAYRLFVRLAGPALGGAAVAVLALHPVMLTSVAWVAARKHLLSCLFIVLATLALVRWLERRRVLDAVWAVLAFACSVGAQPITVLWPLFAFVLTRVRPTTVGHRVGAYAVALGSLPVAVGAVVLNSLYYSGRYVAQSGATKFVEGVHFEVSALALGRAWFNLACPVALATTYDPARWYNLAGLLALPAFAYVVARRLTRAEAWPWALLSALPLAVVLVKMTNIFLADTYLLTPGVGVACLSLLVLKTLSPPALRVAAVAGLAWVAFNAFESFHLVRSYRSDDALWARAYDVEPTPNSLAKHIHFMTSAGQADEALELAVHLRDWQPTHPDLPMVLAAAAYRSTERSWAEKDTLLTNVAFDDPWFWYFHALVKANLQDFAAADELLRRALEAPDRFKQERKNVEADARRVCTQLGRSDCH